MSRSRPPALRLAGAFALSVITCLWMLAPVSPARAEISAVTISSAWNPLGLDIDSSGNVWIGYQDGPEATKGVWVVPATTGTLFGKSVAAGVATPMFPLAGVQGIVRSTSGHLFVATGAGNLYVATDDGSAVFGTATTPNDLTPLSGSGPFRGGLAVDSAGNLYGGRLASGGVAVLPVATGSLYGFGVVANTPQVLVSSPEWTGDIAIDSADNILIGSWFGGSQGVYVLPKASASIYGQAVTAHTLARLVNASLVSGIDVDAANNIYFAQWGIQRINILSPNGGLILGQNFTANVPATLTGSEDLADQGLAVNAQGTTLVSGARSPRATVRITGPTSSPPRGEAPGLVSDVVVDAGDGQATVSWTAPWYPGSEPVSRYAVTASPGGRTCTVSVPYTTPPTIPPTSCTVTGLTNGVPYTFTVQAGSIAGLGLPSTPTAPVTPTATPTPSPRPTPEPSPTPSPSPSPSPAPAPTPTPAIQIVGTRDDERARVTGTTAGLPAGSLVSAHARTGQQRAYQPGARVLVGPTGTFTWERKVARGKTLWVYFTSGSTQSTVIRLPSGGP